MAKRKDEKLSTKNVFRTRKASGTKSFSYDLVTFNSSEDHFLFQIDQVDSYFNDPLSITGMRQFIHKAESYLIESGYKTREKITEPFVGKLPESANRDDYASRWSFLYDYLKDKKRPPHSLEMIYALALMKYEKLGIDPEWQRFKLNQSEEVKLSLAWAIGRLSIQAFIAETQNARNQGNAKKVRKPTPKNAISDLLSSKANREKAAKELWLLMPDRMRDMNRDCDADFDRSGETITYLEGDRETEYTFGAFRSELSKQRKNFRSRS